MVEHGRRHRVTIIEAHRSLFAANDMHASYLLVGLADDHPCGTSGGAAFDVVSHGSGRSLTTTTTSLYRTWQSTLRITERIEWKRADAGWVLTGLHHARSHPQADLGWRGSSPAQHDGRYCCSPVTSRRAKQKPVLIAGNLWMLGAGSARKWSTTTCPSTKQRSRARRYGGLHSGRRSTGAVFKRCRPRRCGDASRYRRCGSARVSTPAIPAECARGSE